MRELDCDFCGATAAGAYEPLPAELDPSPDEQVRVVLCPDCRETLDGVLAPLLDRLGAAGASDASGAADGGTAPGLAPGPGSSSTRVTGGRAAASDADADYDAQADARSGSPDAPADDAVILDADERRTEGDGDEASDDADDEPEGFRQVMRLLGNREFPVERAEVADLAGSAYDLDAAEADEIIDYAVERGVLEEENGRLRKS